MRYLLLPLLFLVGFFTKAQNLYWIGGSGNFNDPKHWSLTSNGPAANTVPNANTNVIFDNSSGDEAVINIVGINVCNSFLCYNEINKIYLNGFKSAKLNVGGDYLLNRNSINYFEGTTILSSSTSSIKSFKPIGNVLKGNILFKSGNWSLGSFELIKSADLTFEKGSFYLTNSHVRATNIFANINNVSFNAVNGVIIAEKKLDFSKALVSNSGLKVIAPINDPGQVSFNDPQNNILKQSIASMACSLTYSFTNPSCFGGNDATISVTVDPGCAPGPFTLNFSTFATCISAVLGSNSVPLAGPTVFTIGGLSGCGGNAVDISLDQGFTTLASITNTTLPINPTPINLQLLASIQPSCSGQCNGSQLIKINGGTGPYTVQVTPPGLTFTTTTGATSTVSGLCAGAHSYSITDSKGCNTVVATSLPATPPIVITPITKTVSCNALCDGAFSVSATGGNPGYTINFSTGASSVVASGATAFISNLCIGAVSATVTDTKGCTASTSTTITQPTPVTITPVSQSVTCFGLCNGSSTLSVSGGISPYTFSWSPGGQTNSVVASLCAGVNTATVFSNGGQCTNTVSVNITQPTSITITSSLTNIQCFGLCNGSASVSASGGVGAMSYTWTAPGPVTISTNTNISGQCAGSYTVTGKDVNSCTVSAVVTITAPPAYTVTTITQTISCFGQCNGSGSVSVSGSNGPPYSFTWSPTPGAGQGTGTITNLCAGNYTATISDGTCIVSPAPVISITQPASITLNPSTGSVTCNGLCNGSINVAPTGGVAPFTYTLLTPGGSTVTTAPPFTGLCAGVHTVMVKDQSNCTQTFTINILQPNPLVPSVSSTSLNCFNVCNGSLAGSVIGGVPGYTLVWTTPTGTVSGGVIGSLCSGTYTFNATDANGCATNSVVTLNQPTAVTATISPTNPSCNGSCNGALNGVASGGTPGYTLSWSNGFTGNPNTGLCAGNYTLTVTDSKGCTSSFTQSLTAPPPVVLTQTNTSPSCAGGCNGSATITATGGTGPYVYQFNTIPVTTNTTGIVTGLCPGNYIGSATDANGCSQSINFTISNPPGLSISLTGLQTSCNLCTGAATVTPVGGTPGYTVAWTNTAGAVGTGTAQSSLCPGSYTATATDATGCSASVTFSMVQTVTVSVIAGGTGIQCFGSCTGSAIAVPIGGTAPYNYTWTPTSQTNPTATALCSGPYTVTVKDALGCTNTATMNLSTPPDITVTTSQTNVSCFGLCNGVLGASASGGTGLLTYSWSPGGQTTQTITNLCSGGYTLTVKDANNCSKILTFSVTQSPSITATFTTTQPTGCTVSNGSICATPSGGSGSGYTFTWSPVPGNASCLTGLGAGTYSLVIADGAGCTTTLSTLLTNPTGPTLAVNVQSVLCSGGSTGSATVTATGTAPFNFTWTPAVGFVNLGNTSTATGLISGTYAIAVSQANGCITTQSISITQAPNFTVNTTATNPKCNASCNGSITLNTSGATPGYTFAWSSATITGVGTQTVTNLCPGGYTVNITDANSCVRTVTFNLVAPPLLTLTNTATNIKCNGACNGSIVATAAGGTAPLSYTWLPVGGFPGASTSTIINLCPNVYTVIATDGNNCTATNTINLTQPAALTSTLVSVNASCSSSCNATASLTGSGGTPTYSFSWSGSGATTPTIGSLCAGNYSGTITDANGCTSVQAFTITSPAAFTASASPTNPLCNASCNGSIATTLSGAQGTVSFNWIPSGTGQNPTSLCAGAYTLTATDAASCQANAVVTLVNPPAILANVTTTNPACNGVCNGVAISTPTNAVGTVNFTWSPAGPNSATNSALCSGNYTLTIQDGNGCQDTQTFSLTDPSLLNVNPSIAPSTCGSSNGSITVVASGGTPAYTYSWFPPASGTNSFVTGLAAGVYTVSVSDFNGCTNTLTIPLSNSNGPSSVAITQTDVVCFGQCTGAASIGVVTGGTPGYTLSWVSPPAPTTSNPLSNLCAGSYTAQVTDANSCILFSGITITQPTSISITPSFGLPTCNGVCNGTIGLNTTGGNGPAYNYTWSPAAPNLATITNVCAGVYTVQIGDALGCVSTTTVNVPAVLNMLATTSVTSNQCFGNCAASASITSISGGLPAYSISWSNGNVGSVASSLCNGTYTAIVTDANGCFNSFTTSITSPAQITATTSVASPSCGMCNGSSSITASGGTAPFTYSWTSGATGTTASNLCAGLYQVLVTDNLGCTSIQNIAISNSSGITGETFNVQNEQCTGMCNGAATVTPIGGTAPITFTWLTMPVVTNSIATGLCSGSYFVQMMDAQGCIRTSSTAITAPTSLSVAPFITQPDCGSTNGTISVVPSGGTPGYTITWLPAGSGTVLTNVGPGNYTATVVDANGCSQSQGFTINNSTAPVITFTQTNINCFNTCTGIVEALGTTTATPVTYNWSTGATTSSVTGLCKGIVTLTVTDNNGCMSLQSFTLTDNPPMQLSLSNIQQPKCNGDCNGQITLIPSGGTLPYSFTWSPTGSSNPQFSLCAGAYSATVIDSKGCSITTTVTLIDPALLALTNTVTNSSCSSMADGSASVTLTGGTPSYTYNWSGPGTFTANTQNLTNILSGNYSLTALDANGCTTTITLQVVPTITVDANAGNDTTFCTNGSVLLSGLNSIGASGGFLWTALPGTLTISNNSTVNVTPATGTSTYVLQVISSVSTCVDFDTVVVNALPLPIVDAGPTFTIPVFSTVTIGGNPTAPTGITYTWIPSGTLDNPNIPNPTASNTVDVTYTIMVTDANGCVASDTMQVRLYPEIVIPNGFSPNGDNKNDKWIIDNIYQFPDNVVEVYNRWGELLFYSKGYTVPFDGRYNGKDLPVGTYYYVINLNHPAYTKPYTGPLTIFR